MTNPEGEEDKVLVTDPDESLSFLNWSNWSVNSIAWENVNKSWSKFQAGQFLSTLWPAVNKLIESLPAKKPPKNGASRYPVCPLSSFQWIYPH